MIHRTHHRPQSPRFWVLLLAAAWLITPPLAAEGPRLVEEVGRREFRIYSDGFPLKTGGHVGRMQLEKRLKRLGYQRVKAKPKKPGRFFWGNQTFWIYQRRHIQRGKNKPERLFGLKLQGGVIRGAVNAEGKPLSAAKSDGLMLEPELLAESLDGDRAKRVAFALDDIPEQVWRPLLAAEDARFFSHHGIDARALGRSLWANIKAGKVVQGGSTITQQLIKNRDLTPKKTLGRKASEAVRALQLEAKYSKEEILEAYLNYVYLGHIDGLHIYGYGTAARCFFGKDLADLSLAECATLAAMVQGPNRLAPHRHPQRVKKRRDWVLSRMAELEWADADAVARAQREPVRTKKDALPATGKGRFLAWVAEILGDEHKRRSNNKRGFVVYTSLDPLLQEAAEKEVARRGDKRLDTALVALDAETGGVLAYVGADPTDRRDDFDRARLGSRQPGSTLKPFILLEAFSKGFGKDAVTPAGRIADRPLEIDIDGKPWRPKNNDRKFHGTVSVRSSLRHSYNVPFVRLGRAVGYARVAARFEDAGFQVPRPIPPSFLLGAIETSPLSLAEAYTVFATGGVRLEAQPIWQTEKPNGGRLKRYRRDSNRVASAASTWLVRELLADVVANGTGKAGKLKDIRAYGKTGTSSNRRDAWFAGFAGSVVCVTWVGNQKDGKVRVSGGNQAAKLWRGFMNQAATARPPKDVPKPNNIVASWIDPKTGHSVKAGKRGAYEEQFRRGTVPNRKRWWRINKPTPVIE
ncbi:transglycosylase domain-containing protein [Acanthopleuribacter pedis]|uniref:Transglycosylase domain-containing protein n=1 Tax=Acanthopleuribacter pedis TaxID=442870 RepID=A0A8J7Q357_9BACT|nr:transglycosylase domain-containing protein [Acanthopleuribacter pedis]MBO1318390.1 transglycosylase domain-containing protein [Acanthopleuribacter pedis]